MVQHLPSECGIVPHSLYRGYAEHGTHQEGHAACVSPTLMQTVNTDRPVNTEPTPDPKTVGERVRTACLVLITLCLVGTTAYFLRPILTPLFTSLFLFFLLNPVTDAVARWRIPYWAAYPVLCIFLVLVLLV